MLEVPALLWQLPELLRDVDFVSVGSNDLMQFLFAADRGTPSLLRPLRPPVATRCSTCWSKCLPVPRPRAAEPACPVSLCGEAASRPLEAMTLVGLGLTSLSMPASGVLGKGPAAAVDLTTFRPVLASIRRGSGGAASLREPIAAWAREHGILV